MMCRIAFLAACAACIMAAVAQADEIIERDGKGGFSQTVVKISPGDTVTWEFPETGGAIVPLADPDDCASVTEWDPTEENAFTGPWPQMASGIMLLGTTGATRVVVPLAEASRECLDTQADYISGGDIICTDASLPQNGVIDEVIAHPGVAGAYLQFDWSDIEPEAGRYDFEALNSAVDQVVAAGKVYSLSFRAGVDGTPAWLDSDLNMPFYQFQDRGSDPRNDSCGSKFLLPDPTDDAYVQRYTQMLRNVANHLKENAARYRALAYVKPSGANLFTAENRLPKRCTEGCDICNSEVWAAAGYTPERLYRFYERQIHAIATYFPDKSMAYQLIQDGFPRVSNARRYEGCVLPNCMGRETPGSGTVISFLPSVSEQTTRILNFATAAFPQSFAVQHNGLDPINTENPCPSGDTHPVDPDGDPTTQHGLDDFTDLPGSCPNAWVLYHGASGHFTGLQTISTFDLNMPQDLDKTLLNGFRNSDAMFVEVYEKLLWKSIRAGDPLDTSAKVPRSLEDWNAAFNDRRRNDLGALGLPVLPDPYPSSHAYEFSNSTGQPLTYWFTDPATCSNEISDTVGEIVVVP